VRRAIWDRELSRLVAVLVSFAAASVPAIAADPPMFRGNLERTGAFGVPTGRWLEGVKWTFATEGPLRASAAFVGDLVLFGSGDGNLYAVEAATGKERWRAPLGGAVHSTPAVEAGRVFVASRKGGLFALDLATGKRIWRFAMGEDLENSWGWDFWLSSPAVSRGIVYAGSGDGHLYAIDARSGKERWRFKTANRVRSSPAIADGVVYFGSRDGRIYALDAQTGKAKWTFEIDGFSIDSVKEGYDRLSINSTPSLSADGLFVGSRDGHEYALDRRTGKLRWKFGHKVTFVPGSPEVSWVDASPSLWRDLVLVGSSDGRTFHATRAATGEEAWRFSTASNVLSSAAVAGGIAFFGCEDSHLFALDAATGKELWRFRAGGPINASPAVAGNLVVVGSDDGKLYALATSDAARPARPRGAVFWTDPGPWKWFKGDAAVRDDLASEGYEVLDGVGLARFFSEADPAESVVVMASDRFPDDVVTEPFKDCLLRRYLAAGGRVVWLGILPHLVTIDSKTGKPTGTDQARSERLLEVRLAGALVDKIGSEATAEGRRWGLPAFWIGGFPASPRDVTTVLGLDEYGQASAWVKSFGGPPGSGFVRVWGREDAPSDLAWLRAVAAH
jgi:outer membrane protein assembly factor BamB